MNTTYPKRHVLFATDYSENSRLALDYAVMFAQRFKATVYTLHVVLLSQAAQEAELESSGPSLSRKSADRRLEAAGGLRRLGLEVETHRLDGPAAEVIPALRVPVRLGVRLPVITIWHEETAHEVSSI